MTDENRARALVEAMLFAYSRPLGEDHIREATGLSAEEVQEALRSLMEEYAAGGRGFSLAEVAGGFQLRTRPDFAPEVSRLFQARPRRRFTRSSLEALAIIAYRQPVSRTEVEQIRGVDCGAVIKNLLEGGMVRILGRKEGPGRPFLYGTSQEFLEYFGLRDLESLPALEEVVELEGEGLVPGPEEGDAERMDDAPPETGPAGESRPGEGKARDEGEEPDSEETA